MNIIGNYTRSISRQSGCAFDFFLRPQDPYQVMRVGLSGAPSGPTDTIHYLVSGSRVYDHVGNFVSSLNDPTQIQLGYHVGDGVAMGYVNGELVTSFFDNFSELSYVTIDNTGVLDFDLYLSGSRPLINYSGINNFDSGIELVTGVLVNESPARYFRILSGDVINPSQAGVVLSGWETGDITNTGALYFSALAGGVNNSGEANVLLYTNFGQVNFFIDVATNQVDQDDYLNIWPNVATFIEDSIPNSYFTESYFNFGTRQLELKLQYISGGDSYELTTVTGLGTGYLYGEIVGSGLITGQISGLLSGGTYYQQDITGVSIVTGNFTGTFQTDGTGTLNGEVYTGILYSGYDFNYDSGIGGCFLTQIGTGTLSGSYDTISGSGFHHFTGIFGDEFVYPYGGYLTRNVYNGDMSGSFYIFTTNQAITSTDNITVFVQNDTSFDSFSFNFNSGSSYSGTSGLFYVYTGYDEFSPFSISGDMHFNLYVDEYTGAINSAQFTFPNYINISTGILASGEFTGFCFSETVNEMFLSGISSGYYVSTGKLNFTDIWNIKTGQYFPIIYDHKAYGWYDSGKYFHSGAEAYLRSSFKNYSAIEINYSGLGTSGINIVKLLASDGFLTSELLISGTGEIL